MLDLAAICYGAGARVACITAKAKAKKARSLAKLELEHTRPPIVTEIRKFVYATPSTKYRVPSTTFYVMLSAILLVILSSIWGWEGIIQILNGGSVICWRVHPWSLGRS